MNQLKAASEDLFYEGALVKYRKCNVITTSGKMKHVTGGVGIITSIHKESNSYTVLIEDGTVVIFWPASLCNVNVKLTFISFLKTMR